MTTAQDILSLALRDSGVLGIGQTANAQDMSDALAKLNYMLGQWNDRRWLVYHLVDVSKVSTGATSYTIGAGGDINTARPDLIQAAFVRLNANTPTQFDFPLRVITSREDYNLIPNKVITGLPSAVYYDANYPLGTVYFWPVPTAGIYELHLTLKAQLGSFASLTDVLNVPNEYLEAMHYNLVARLRSAYQMPVDPVAIGLARAAMATIRSVNAQIPAQRLPAALLRNGAYNIYTDSYT